jgi:hypothetical protein
VIFSFHLSTESKERRYSALLMLSRLIDLVQAFGLELIPR